MQLRCNKCGKPVSTEVPDETIVRAWTECPECIEAQGKASGQQNVIRVLIYTGSQEWLSTQLGRSLADGVKEVKGGSITTITINSIAAIKLVDVIEQIKEAL